jgi:glycosyltransferase involved in cell wall biosynthesis
VPDVSVIVPTRDRVPFLRQSLRSVLGQRDVDLEVIIVDDGSRNDVAGELKGFLDDRCHVHRNGISQGVSRARNRGIRAAQAPWIAFLDDDDLWSPDKLRLQLAVAADASARWAYTGSVNVSPSLQVVGGTRPAPPKEVVASIRSRNLVPGGTSSVMVERDLVLGLGGFDSQLAAFADWDLWMRLAEVGDPAVVARPSVAYRLHAGNMTVVGETVERDLAIFMARGIEVDRGAVYRWLGWWARRGGRKTKAIGYLLRAWRSRTPEFELADLRGDVSYIAREMAERARSRYLKRFFRRSWLPQPERGDLEWLMEAERWIEHLKTNGGGTSRNVK